MTIPDKLGSISFGATMFASPGRWTDRNEDVFFNISRAGASADYLHGVFNVNRTTRLPYGFQWTVRARMQWASDNLVGSEQLGAGGAYSVRGYEEGKVIGDKGAVFGTELIAPAIKPRARVGALKVPDSLRFYSFYDAARLSSVNKAPGEPANTELHSLGVGFRYRLRNNFNAEGAYGWQLTDSGSSRSGDNSRGHISVTLSF